MTARVRRTAGSLASLMLASAALTGLALTQGPLAPQQSQPSSNALELAGCIGACAHPTNAGKVFRWGREKWRDEFEVGAFPPWWESNHPRFIGQQNGMLTIKAKARTKKVVAWPNGKGARYGRWEARVRAVELTSRGRHFKFNWELSPAKGSLCNDSKIVMASYRPGQRLLKGVVRTRPDYQYSFARRADLRSRAWHTYAIEVTPDHISWFMDTRVIHTERRPHALSGKKFRPQFVIEGFEGDRMRKSWLQMDWVRHYTLERPNAKSIKAPRMKRSRYKKGC